jgi:hypothetical protein
MSQRICEYQVLQRFALRERLKTRIDPADGTLIAPGKLGNIYQHDHCSLAVMVLPPIPRRRYWRMTRNKLVGLGFTVVQDGDGEGAATFDPSTHQHLEHRQHLQRSNTATP